MASEARLLELIAGRREGVLAGVAGQGYPHLTNIWYVWDDAQRVARISTTADRVKGRMFRRDPHAALYVPGPDFQSYAVAQGDIEPSGVATQPGDAATRELFDVHSHFSPGIDKAQFFRRMVDERRLVLRLHVKHVYGIDRHGRAG